jgi:uncharacterized membrane protein YkvA (DUF1232 family)
MNEEPQEHEVEVIEPARTDRPNQVDEKAVVPAAESRRRSGFKSFLARVPGIPTLYGLWIYLMDDESSDLHRFLILLALLYLISPADLLPEYILGPLGLVDDVAAIGILIKFIGSPALAPYREQARKRLREE